MTRLLLRKDRYGPVTGEGWTAAGAVVESGTAVEELGNSPLGG
jgi:hypothetical protein